MQRESRQSKNIAFTNKALLMRQKEQQNRHVERVKRAHDKVEDKVGEREPKCEKRGERSKKSREHATRSATVQKRMKETTGIYSNSSQPQMIAGKPAKRSRRAKKLVIREHEGKSNGGIDTMAEMGQSEASEDFCEIDHTCGESDGFRSVGTESDTSANICCVPRDVFNDKLNVSGTPMYLASGLSKECKECSYDSEEMNNFVHKADNLANGDEDDEHDNGSLDDAQSEYTDLSDRRLHHQDSHGTCKTFSSASTTALAQFSDTVVRPDGRWDHTPSVERSVLSSEDTFDHTDSGRTFSLFSPPNPSWESNHTLDLATRREGVENVRKSQKKIVKQPERMLATAAPSAILGTRSRSTRPLGATSGRGGAGSGASSFSSRSGAGARANEDEQSARRLAGAWMEQQQKEAKKQLRTEEKGPSLYLCKTC